MRKERFLGALLALVAAPGILLAAGQRVSPPSLAFSAPLSAPAAAVPALFGPVHGVPGLAAAAVPAVPLLSPSAAPSGALEAAAPAAAQPLRLLITGAPGAGKGEASKRLSRDYGLVHISAGDLLRDYAKTDPEIAAVMRRGDLVPVELVVGLVRERLAQADVAQRGFVLDGFPRRLAEAEALHAEIAAGRIVIDAVIVLDVPKAELKRRILGRGRADDNEDVFDHRMDIYDHVTLPAVAHMTSRLPALKPDVGATSGVEASYALVKSAVDGFLAAPRRP